MYPSPTVLHNFLSYTYSIFIYFIRVAMRECVQTLQKFTANLAALILIYVEAQWRHQGGDPVWM